MTTPYRRPVQLQKDPAMPDAQPLPATGKAVLARQKLLARRDGWIAELADHRAIHNQSRFRWWADDVLSAVTWNTWGRIDFTTVEHLAWLEEWRQSMYDLAYDCGLWMGEPFNEVRGMFVWTYRRNELGDVVGLSPYECAYLLHLYAVTPTARRVPNSQVKRIHRMAFSNPLIRIWELKQLWRMYLAAVDVHEDTLIDLVEELRPTHRMSDILRASNTYDEQRLDERIAKAREDRGGPGDPRRVPRQTFV